MLQLISERIDFNASKSSSASLVSTNSDGEPEPLISYDDAVAYSRFEFRKNVSGTMSGNVLASFVDKASFVEDSVTTL